MTKSTNLASNNEMYNEVIKIVKYKNHEIGYLNDEIMKRTQAIANILIKKNKTFKQVLEELNTLHELIDGLFSNKLMGCANDILQEVRAIINKEMESAECKISKECTKGKEIKNTDGNTVMKINEDGIEVNGVLKINQEQEQETEGIHYLPVETMKFNLAPEFIKQVTEEVIKKMKENNYIEITENIKEEFNIYDVENILRVIDREMNWNWSEYVKQIVDRTIDRLKEEITELIKKENSNTEIQNLKSEINLLKNKIIQMECNKYE